MSDNSDRTRKGFEAFGRGDLETLRELFDPDVVWHVPGRSELAGDYRGVDAVLGYFVTLFERSGGTFRADLLECGDISSDSVACVVRLTGNMQAAPVDTRSMMLFQERGGRMVEVWSFYEDQYAIDEANGVGTITLPEARAGEQAAQIRT